MKSSVKPLINNDPYIFCLVGFVYVCVKKLSFYFDFFYRFFPLYLY